MAVLVEFRLPGAGPEQMHRVEARTQERGAELGRAPYDGLLFLAVAPDEGGLRVVSAWRTEEAFRVVLDGMLGPDLAEVGLAPADVRVSPVASMAIPH